MYNANPQNCTHPAQIKGRDGLMHCLVCGADFKPAVKKLPKNNEKKSEGKKSEGDDKKPDEDKSEGDKSEGEANEAE